MVLKVDVPYSVNCVQDKFFYSQRTGIPTIWLSEPTALDLSNTYNRVPWTCYTKRIYKRGCQWMFKEEVFVVDWWVCRYNFLRTPYLHICDIRWSLTLIMLKLLRVYFLNVWVIALTFTNSKDIKKTVCWHFLYQVKQGGRDMDPWFQWQFCRRGIVSGEESSSCVNEIHSWSNMGWPSTA